MSETDNVELTDRELTVANWTSEQLGQVVDLVEEVAPLAPVEEIAPIIPVEEVVPAAPVEGNSNG